MTKREEIKELWLWCGLTCYEDDTTWSAWYDNKGKLICCGHLDEMPALTLDNLFLYAVPKLKKVLDVDCISFDNEGCSIDYWTQKVEIDRFGISSYRGESSDPAEALAKAILEVIRSGEKGRDTG